MSVVERTKLWAEYKEKKLREAQDQKEKTVTESQGCTFKPQINHYSSRKTQQNDNLSQNKGLDKYLQRMDKAKELKEEKQKLEEQLFNKGQNWKPKLTTPVEPKLSSYISRDQTTIKALNKPVSIYNEGKQRSNESGSKLSSSDENHTQEDRQEFSPSTITKTKDFIQLANKCKDQFVEIKYDMNYDEAVSLIHQHILNLEI